MAIRHSGGRGQIHAAQQQLMTPFDGAFDPRVHLAAQRLLDAGRIADVRVLQNGRVVTGIANPDTALPDAGAPHRVYIRYRQQNLTSGELILEGECSCGERSPCPHVAAVAMSAATRGCCCWSPVWRNS